MNAQLEAMGAMWALLDDAMERDRADRQRAAERAGAGDFCPTCNVPIPDWKSLWQDDCRDVGGDRAGYYCLECGACIPQPTKAEHRASMMERV